MARAFTDGGWEGIIMLLSSAYTQPRGFLLTDKKRKTQKQRRERKGTAMKPWTSCDPNWASTEGLAYCWNGMETPRAVL